MKLILFTIVFSSLITYYSVPIVKKIGLTYKLLDFPDFRKTHKVPIVRIGGMGIILGWILTLLIVFFIKPEYLEFQNINSRFSFIELISCSILFFMIGFSDDIKRLSPYIRLFLQFVVASICWGAGLSINYLNLNFINLNFEYIELSVLISYLITTFFIVGFINAFNWWDGLDGLATGTAIISTLFLFLIDITFYKYIPSYSSLLIASFLGSLLGFLKHNFKPAIILMGDGGAYFIGFYLAQLILLNNFHQQTNLEVVSSQTYSPLLTIIVVLPIIVDMIKVIYLRLISLKLLVKPDRLHLHHDLLKLGLSEKETVMQMYALIFLSSSFSFLFIDIKFSNFYFYISCLIFCVITLINFKKKIFN